MQINCRLSGELLNILDTFIKEKKNTTGTNIARNTLVNDAIFKLIDVSTVSNFGSNTSFINFGNYRYNFFDYPETIALINELVNAKAEIVSKRFKESNYLTEKGLHTLAILALPDIVETWNSEFRIAEKILSLAIYQIIDLDNDIDGPKNLIHQKAMSLLMEESQNKDKADGYYYFRREDI